MALEVSLATAIATAGAASAVVGTGAQIYGQRQQTAATKRAESARKRQLNLESSRKQREILRSRMIADATTAARGTGQGVSLSDSSIMGSFGQNAGLAGMQSNDQYQNTDVGNILFSANADAAEGQATSSIGKSLFGFGTDLINVAPTAGKIGAELFGSGSQPGRISSSNYGDYTY